MALRFKAACMSINQYSTIMESMSQRNTESHCEKHCHVAALLEVMQMSVERADPADCWTTRDGIEVGQRFRIQEGRDERVRSN